MARKKAVAPVVAQAMRRVPYSIKLGNIVVPDEPIGSLNVGDPYVVVKINGDLPIGGDVNTPTAPAVWLMTQEHFDQFAANNPARVDRRSLATLQWEGAKREVMAVGIPSADVLEFLPFPSGQNQEPSFTVIGNTILQSDKSKNRELVHGTACVGNRLLTGRRYPDRGCLVQSAAIVRIDDSLQPIIAFRQREHAQLAWTMYDEFVHRPVIGKQASIAAIYQRSW